MHKTAAALVAFLFLAGCSEVNDGARSPAPPAAAPDAVPDAPTPLANEGWLEALPPDASLDEAIVLLTREALREAAGAEQPADSLRIDDKTPRLDAEREPAEGFVWLFFHSAGVHVSVEGLTGLSFDLNERGLRVLLSYGSDTLEIEDRGRGPYAVASLGHLRRAGEKHWTEVWPKVEALYRAWATAADALPEDLEGAWK
ncbi:MAG: hypothetical protein ACYTDX_09715, partial [Planctomycetota bacterium]